MLHTARLPTRLAALLLVALAPQARAGEAPQRVEDVVRRYAADEASLRRFYGEPLSSLRLDRLGRFLDAWQSQLDAIDASTLDGADAIDLALLRNHVGRRQDELTLQAQRNAETAPLLPFAAGLIALEDGQRGRMPLVPRAAAEVLARMRGEVASVRERVEAGRREQAPPDALRTTPAVALRASRAVERLVRLLESWFRFRDGYEPAFGWWVRTPYATLRKALQDYAAWLRHTVAGVPAGEDGPLVGDPIGREALCRALARELIPYTPEQLLAIAEREFAWCEEQGRKAAAELDKQGWAAAVEHVKLLHRAPGEQDELVAAQAREAIAFLEQRDLLTVPALAAETWRLRMIDEKGQRTLPFAVYNDQQMLVAYPTEGMEHERKLQGMRGNNEHFTRIVTPHELIPGHHLQLFMAKRHNTHRALFRTPFLVEGWALHWEMLLWDLGWARGPEDRVGMLFWRMHRCARILVTLRFHLGAMEPEAMVRFLRERVGLEEDGARGEVRRYLGGAYGPLYQCAYMIGGLQMRALHHELVGGGVMGNRAFHDAVLRQGSIPIAMIRAALRGASARQAGGWRFAGDVTVEGAAPCPR